MALNEVRFEVDMYADGMRIYAKLACETIGAIDARQTKETRSQLAITAIYVVPRWRDRGIASAMLEFFDEHTERASVNPTPIYGN